MHASYRSTGRRGQSAPYTLSRTLFVLVLLIPLIGSTSAFNFFENVNTTGDLPANQTTVFAQWTDPFSDFLFEFIPDFVIRVTQGGQGALLCIAFIAGIGVLGRVFR